MLISYPFAPLDIPTCPQVAVRCSLRLEVPIADTGVLLCPDEYVRYMVRLANDKFTSNEERVAKLEEQIREAFKVRTDSIGV